MSLLEESQVFDPSGLDRPPVFPLGEPARSSWREGAMTRANELETLARWLVRQCDGAPSGELFDALRAHVKVARDAAESTYGMWHPVTGSTTERVESNPAAAEADLLQLAPLAYVRGQLPGLVAHAKRHLPTGDSRRRRLERLWEAFMVFPDRGLTQDERLELVSIVRAAGSEACREKMRARSFRNVLIVTTVVLTGLAVALAVFGVRDPDAIPLCFTPVDGAASTVVCPTQSSGPLSPPKSATDPDIDNVTAQTVTPVDVLLVEALGLGAAALAAAAAIRGIKGTSTPFSIPLALALLKLPCGALTAFFGLLLLRGQFFPGLSALDTSAQILAWAVVFGYGQQLFTRMVDQQAQNVLHAVGGKSQDAA
ncbi:MAG: hypothetical protein ACLGIA_07380 [Actinomycetes bacterium]